MSMSVSVIPSCHYHYVQSQECVLWSSTVTKNGSDEHAMPRSPGVSAEWPHAHRERERDGPVLDPLSNPSTYLPYQYRPEWSSWPRSLPLFLSSFHEPPTPSLHLSIYLLGPSARNQSINQSSTDCTVRERRGRRSTVDGRVSGPAWRTDGRWQLGKAGLWPAEGRTRTRRVGRGSVMPSDSSLLEVYISMRLA